MASNEVSFWLSLIQVSHPEQKRLFRYQLHQLIWRAFPGFPAGSKQPFLFTLTGREDHEGIYCLVQSATKPDWQKATQKNGCNSLIINKLHGVKSVWFTVHPGDQFFFQIDACPVKNIFQGRHQRGKKAPIYNPVEAERWFERRAEQNGFTVLQNELYIKKNRIRSKADLNGKDITLITSHFTGLLEVKNEKRFAEALLTGIGKKKIFGFGILMLSPASKTN